MAATATQEAAASTATAAEALQGDVDDCHFPRGKKSVWGVFIFFPHRRPVARSNFGCTLLFFFFFACFVLSPLHDLFGLTFRAVGPRPWQAA